MGLPPLTQREIHFYNGGLKFTFDQSAYDTSKSSAHSDFHKLKSNTSCWGGEVVTGHDHLLQKRPSSTFLILYSWYCSKNVINFLSTFQEHSLQKFSLWSINAPTNVKPRDMVGGFDCEYRRETRHHWHWALWFGFFYHDVGLISGHIMQENRECNMELWENPELNFEEFMHTLVCTIINFLVIDNKILYSLMQDGFLPPLLEWNESWRVSSTDTRFTMLHRLIGNGKLSQIMPNHLGLKMKKALTVSYRPVNTPWPLPGWISSHCAHLWRSQSSPAVLSCSSCGSWQSMASHWAEPPSLPCATYFKVI